MKHTLSTFAVGVGFGVVLTLAALAWFLGGK